MESIGGLLSFMALELTDAGAGGGWGWPAKRLDGIVLSSTPGR